MYWGLPTAIPFIALFCYGALLFLTFRQGLQKRVNRFFALYLLAMLVWSFGALLMYVDSPRALLWNKVMLSGLVGMPLTFFAFVRGFLRVERQRWLLYLGGMALVSLWVLNARGYLTSYIHFTEDGLLRYQFGPAFPLFAADSALFLSLSTLSLIRGYRETRDSIEQNRLRYAFFGISAVVLGSSTNLIPALGAYPIDIAANVVDALLLAYAIFRYQLLDISVAVRRGLLYSIPTAVIGTSYFLIVYLIVKLFRTITEYQILLLALVMAAVTAVAVQPLRDRVQSWLDKLFFREKYDSALMLQRLSRTVASVLDLDRLTGMILDEVTATMHIARAAFFLKQEESGEFHLAAQRGLNPDADLRLRKDHPIVGWLSSHEHALTRHEVEVMPQFRALWTQEREDLENLGAELFIPLRAKEKLVGIFAVGPKLSEEMYSPDDQRTLITLANQTAVAIENARLYDAAQQELSERERAQEALQKAHGELGRRIGELSTMQEIARDLNASLDLDRVLNLVLERAIKITPAHAGAITLLDRERGGLLVAAMQGFPPHMGVYRFQPWPLEQGIIGWVARTGQSSLVTDVTQDPRYFAAVPSTRSQLTVPLLANMQVIGVIALESSELAGFDEEHLRYLSSLADQAAIAIKNAQLHARAEELATAEERTRIAREMHDGLAQDLAALGLRVQRSLKLIDTDPAMAKAELIRIRTVLQQDAQDLRRLILALRPLDLEELGFSAALHKLISEYEADSVIAIHLSGVEAVPYLSRELEFVLFRVVQESLSNVSKHAQAKNAWIDLASDSPGVVSLTIRDDGRGFDSGEAMTEGLSHGRLGLLYMQERVEALGGTLVINTAPTSGTRVAVTLPISDPGRKSRDEPD